MRPKSAASSPAEQRIAPRFLCPGLLMILYRLRGVLRLRLRRADGADDAPQVIHLRLAEDRDLARLEHLDLVVAAGLLLAVPLRCFLLLPVGLLLGSLRALPQEGVHHSLRHSNDQRAIEPFALDERLHDVLVEREPRPNGHRLVQGGEPVLAVVGPPVLLQALRRDPRTDCASERDALRETGVIAVQEARRVRRQRVDLQKPGHGGLLTHFSFRESCPK
jgi:hypothetical protein